MQLDFVLVLCMPFVYSVFVQLHAATDPDLQDLLNIMVTDTMKNERFWDVDEVMSRLKTNCQQ